MNASERKSIHALAVRFANGERATFDPLFDALYPVLQSFARRSLDPTDADDAAQEAMIKVFSRITDLDPTRDVVAWALGIAGYEVLTIRRSRSRRRELGLELGAAAVDPRPDPEDVTALREIVDALTSHLGTLDERDRAEVERELRGEIAVGERDRKRRWRALDRLRRFWRTSHG